ncbi:hypothetical protein BH09BAC4_BH09BAC4_17570 [soil metagenome]
MNQGASSINWINIKDQQPMGEIQVLAIGHQDEMLIGLCYRQGDGFNCKAESAILENVSHWLNLGELRSLLHLQRPNQ